MKIIKLLFLLLFGFTLSGQNIDTFQFVPKIYWVQPEAKFINKVNTGNNFIYKGHHLIQESCVIKYPKQVRYISDFDSTTVLLEYINEDDKYGTECENGNIFVFDKKEWLNFNIMYGYKTEEDLKREQKIIKILNKKY